MGYTVAERQSWVIARGKNRRNQRIKANKNDARSKQLTDDLMAQNKAKEQHEQLRDEAAKKYEKLVSRRNYINWSSGAMNDLYREKRIQHNKVDRHTKELMAALDEGAGAEEITFYQDKITAANAAIKENDARIDAQWREDEKRKAVIRATEGRPGSYTMPIVGPQLKENEYLITQDGCSDATFVWRHEPANANGAWQRRDKVDLIDLSIVGYFLTPAGLLRAEQVEQK